MIFSKLISYSTNISWNGQGTMVFHDWSCFPVFEPLWKFTYYKYENWPSIYGERIVQKDAKKLVWYFMIGLVFPFLNYCENSHTMNKYIPHLLREFAVVAHINYITIIWEFHPIWETYNPPFTEGECEWKNACIPWLVKIHSDQVPQVLWHSQLFQCN
jgi:hypothetical protein